MCEAMESGHDDGRANKDAHVLRDAHEITRDKSRMKAIGKHVDMVADAYHSMTGKRGMKRRGRGGRRR